MNCIDVSHIWVRLHYLLLEFLCKYAYEAITNSLDHLLKVELYTINFYHTSFSCILVDFDLSKDLPNEIVVLVNGLPYTHMILIPSRKTTYEFPIEGDSYEIVG